MTKLDRIRKYQEFALIAGSEGFQVFLEDVRRRRNIALETLADAESVDEIRRLQGEIRAFRAVLEAPKQLVNDANSNPDSAQV